MRWRPILTPARRRHLEALADGLPRKVGGRGTTGYSCRVLGWCSFAVRDLSTGEIITKQEAQRRLNERGRHELWQEGFRFIGDEQIITPEGLRLIGEADKR